MDSNRDKNILGGRERGFRRAERWVRNENRIQRGGWKPEGSGLRCPVQSVDFIPQASIRELQHHLSPLQHSL